MATDLMGLTEYQKLLNAVENYYGAGSDQWLTIASQSNIQSTEWAEILRQTPNVNVVTNNAGEVVSYTVSESFGTAVDSAGAVINSNTQAATMSQAAQVSIPANTTVSQTGTVAASSGMKTVASGATVKTVMKDVALGVGAVACGIQAGSKVSNAVYTVGGLIWDRDELWAFNPQNWDTICETKEGKDFFNMVFGINKTTGKTQAYIDQNAFAHIIGYLASLGAYAPSDPTADVPTTDPAYSSIESLLPIAYCRRISYERYDHRARLTYEVDDNSVICAAWRSSAHDSLDAMIMTKNSGNVFRLTYEEYGGSTQVFTQEINTSASLTLGGNTYNFYKYTFSPDRFYLEGVINEYNTHSGFNNNYIAYPYLADEITSGGGIEGLDPQTGAVLPTGITPTMTIADILSYLQTIYPDMFDDAIYNDVVQDDGTVKRFTYVPVGFPDGFTYNETTGDIQPTGGEGTTQADPAIDPSTNIDTLIETLLEILEGTDPYHPTTPPDDVTTDYPDTGGGNTPVIVLPTGSASALYSVYNPSQGEVNSLGAWLWSSDFVDQLLKLFNDPMQAIIGLHKVFATPPISGTGTIKVGYLNSGVSANLVSAQYTEVDCGTIQLKEYFGNALDYIKTDVYLYLPFVGIVPLNVEDVTRATIGVKYKVDVLTGACLATVNVTRDNNAGGQLYAYAGNCAVQYPLSSGSYMGIVSSILGIAGSVAGTVLSGGAMLPVALGVGASALNSAKTRVEHSGSLSGNAGAMGIKKPYLIIRRPQTKIANNYPLLAGGSDNTYGVLSSFTGHVRVKYVHIENIPATSDELNEIETLLKSGVMI